MGKRYKSYTKSFNIWKLCPSLYTKKSKHIDTRSNIKYMKVSTWIQNLNLKHIQYQNMDTCIQRKDYLYSTISTCPQNRRLLTFPSLSVSTDDPRIAWKIINQQVLDANKFILKWIPSHHDPMTDLVLSRGGNQEVSTNKKNITWKEAW